MPAPSLPLPPLRISLVGYGGFGRVLREAWEAAEGATVVAVAALDGGPQDLPVLSDWAALWDRGDVHLLAVATPPSTHADIAVAALDAGKHVIVEKPVALSLDDADRLLAARDRSGRVAVVDFMLRFNPASRHSSTGPAAACSAACPGSRWRTRPSASRSEPTTGSGTRPSLGASWSNTPSTSSTSSMPAPEGRRPASTAGPAGATTAEPTASSPSSSTPPAPSRPTTTPVPLHGSAPH